MITFPETLDATERLAELLKSASALDSALTNTVEDLGSFLSVLEYSHTKKFENTEAALQYIDKVLIPQLRGIKDRLEVGTSEPLKRLNMARDQAKRLMVRLQVLTDGSMGNFLS